MARTLSNFVCQQCGYVSPSFLGKCPNCESWNSLVETTSEIKNQKSKIKSTSQNSKILRLSEVGTEATERVATGIVELDRVLGGGMVPGMAILLAGEPGIGKSTLLLQLADSAWRIARSGDHEPRATSHVLYVAGEESAGQIKIRASRLGVAANNLLILEQTDVDVVTGVIGELIKGEIQDTGYKTQDKIKDKGQEIKERKRENGDGEIGLSLIIVDSVQTLTTDDLVGTAGSVGQVRECAARLISAVKRLGLPIFLIGHVTKDGAIAGPKVLEHMVDTVLTIEGERYEGLRLIRTSKNRFGPTDEVGVFSMTDRGLVPADSESLFAGENGGKNPGSCLTVAMEGTRPMLVEIQALVTSTPLPTPRRVASGVDYNRLQTIVAILQKRLNLPLWQQDIYVSVAGGLKLGEPAMDLPIALAILTSYKGKALSVKTVAIGELDLLGNVRPVNSLERRVKEAKLRGFANVLTAKTLRSLPELHF